MQWLLFLYMESMIVILSPNTFKTALKKKAGKAQ